MAYWLAVTLVTLLDQATKAVVKEILQVEGASCPFIPNVMELRLVYNTGAAFSIGRGAGFVFIVILAGFGFLPGIGLPVVIIVISSAGRKAYAKAQSKQNK